MSRAVQHARKLNSSRLGATEQNVAHYREAAKTLVEFWAGPTEFGADSQQRAFLHELVDQRVGRIDDIGRDVARFPLDPAVQERLSGRGPSSFTTVIMALS